MRWKLVALALILFVKQDALTSNFQDGQDDSISGGPHIECRVTTTDAQWRRGKKNPLVSVKLEAGNAVNVSVMPSLHLMALPKQAGPREDEYWAPFSMTDGKEIHDWQLLDLPPGSPVSVQVSPVRLLWGLTKSSGSIWPTQRFSKAVLPGKYSLQVQIETKNGRTISSNEIEITVAR